MTNKNTYTKLWNSQLGVSQGQILVGIIGSIAILLMVARLAISGTTGANTQTSALKADSLAKIEILDDPSHNWGKIDINGGIVEKVFQIKNTGESDLEITNFKTSCMCTETQVSIKGEQSPVFGMHTQSGWKGAVKPGETADVVVAFDPLFHGPQGTGPITRLVSFDTNDASNRKVEFKLIGNVMRMEN